MNNIKRYNQYNESLSQDLKAKLSDEYKDIKLDILDMIEKSLNSSDIEVVAKFISSYLEEDSESVIEGLVNDSDIYEFYLKHTDSIDEILLNKKFFEKSPLESSVTGLYSYLVYGTTNGVKSIVNLIKKDL